MTETMQTPPPPPPPADRRTAKAAAKAEKARAKALRPWYAKKRFIVPLALVALVVVVGALGSGSDDNTTTAAGGNGTVNTVDRAAGVDTNSNNTDNPPQNDVAITGCTTAEFTGPEAAIEITNHSSKRSNYMVEISFESQDGANQYGTGTAFVNNLEPGQSKAETATAFEDIADGTAFTCRVVNVDRFAA